MVITTLTPLLLKAPLVLMTDTAMVDSVEVLAQGTRHGFMVVVEVGQVVQLLTVLITDLTFITSQVAVHHL